MASQIDGDNLKGFNQSGYSLGALGGFALNDRQWIVVECTYQTFGSVIKDELKNLNTFSRRDLYEWDMSSAGVFLGFSQHLGNKPNNTLQFRFLGGFRTHGIIKKEVKIEKAPGSVHTRFINSEDIKNLMVSLTLGGGVFITKNLILDVTYDYAVTDLTIAPDEDMLVLPDVLPYYYTFSLSYYLSAGYSKKKRRYRGRHRR